MPVAGQRQAQGGLLTAGVWHDSRNFDFFLGFSHKLGSENRQSPDFDLFSDDELRAARAQNLGQQHTNIGHRS